MARRSTKEMEANINSEEMEVQQEQTNNGGSEEVVETAEKTVENTDAKEQKSEYNAMVEKLMKLYPHMEKLYITNDGFVHAEDSPKYLIENAVLYKNKYFKK